MNLNTATPEELQSYKEAVCAVLGIDPLMLDYIMMPDPMGYTGTNRVLYAKRGAAEVLRKNIGIDVLSLTPYESNGWLLFTAVAKNREGRQEVAVGAAYTQGITGEKVAHAVMTAQTRAVRRVTLQFVTGGILDESEVQTQTQFSQAPAASGAALAGSPMVVPPPVVPANVAPGKDTTPNPAIEAAANGSPVLGTPVVTTTSAAPEAAPEAQKAKKERKPRKPKGEVSIASPGQMEIPAGYIDASGTVRPLPPETVKFTEQDKQAAFAAQQKQMADEAAAYLKSLPPTLSAPVAVPGVTAVETAQPALPQAQVVPLTPAQNEMYKAKSRSYTNDIFVKGGMLPSDGIGGITMKFRAFAQKHTGATSHVLTAEQNGELFSFLDGFTKQFGEAALVQYINKALGV